MLIPPPRITTEPQQRSRLCYIPAIGVASIYQTAWVAVVYLGERHCEGPTIG